MGSLALAPPGKPLNRTEEKIIHFTIAKTQKQPKCQLTMEVNKNVVVIEYYSVIKRNEIISFAATWMDLEIVILTEVSQTEKDKYIA